MSGTEVQVTETNTVTWDGKSTYFPANKNFHYFTIYPPLISQETNLESQIQEIIVVDESGKKLSFEKKIEGGGLELKVPYYKDLVNGVALRFKLTYKTTLLTKKEGGVLEILHNAISKDFQSRRKSSSGNYDEVNTMEYVFNIPTTLGVPDFYLPASGKVTLDSLNSKIRFTHDDLKENAVRITVGKKRMVKFVLTANVSKTNDETNNLFKQIINNQIQLALPNDFDANGQKVFFTSITPYPNKVEVDADGNLIATIPVSATESGEIRIEGFAEITRQPFAKDSLFKWAVTDIPADLLKYTQPALPDWPSQDSKIAAIAVGLKDPNGSILQSANNSVKFVIDTLEYRNFTTIAELRRLGALGALESKKGVCMEYSDLLLTLLRNQGIPTRNVYGDGVGSLIDRSINGIGHQWVEIWLPEKGWTPIDPTWSENGYIVQGPDLDHFVWYKTSESPDEPSGFSCTTWDDQSPCEDNILIDTDSVDELPDTSQLLSVSQLIQDVNQKQTQSWTNLPVISPIVSFIGNSSVGRFLANGTTVNILLAVFSYIILFIVVKWLFGLYKRFFGQRDAPYVMQSAPQTPVQPPVPVTPPFGSP